MPAQKPTRQFLLLSAASPRREGTVPRGCPEPEAVQKVPLLVIVANTDARLCRCVRAAFAGSESVRVILDRRLGDRRQEPRGVGAERRSGERRDRLLIGERLRSDGWALVHQPSC
ncbi:MAG: hypothetical protein DME06_04700 [Candidatus Rokuibacteriota bacterium]|nr:MAG: hypothetical protein DME09_08910 [Candidatus Rokubacteria bacterium]PYN14540.1 MAG: hypothetical protein DME06_04700 [Candidatus Rokubacteria bacterium]